MRLASFTVRERTGPSTRVGVVVEGDGASATDGGTGDGTAGETGGGIGSGTADAGEPGASTTEDDVLLDVTTGYAALLAADGERAPSRRAAATAPPDMLSFLQVGEPAFDAARRVRESAPELDTGPDGATVRYPLDDPDVTLESPLPRPNSLRDFMVFEEHVRNSLGDEIPDVWFDVPVYYKGNPDAVVRPGADVEWPAYTDQLDYELEVAAVVGRKGRDVHPADADDYIAGYTVFDDFSARDVQLREMQARLGPAKGKDFANGLGPYLVTPDAFDVADATMTAHVNGEQWSAGTPGAMEHSFADIVAHVSDGETIYPGDVLGSGTVGRGCGLELGRWLSPGDTVELTVEGIGTLAHRVVDPD